MCNNCYRKRVLNIIYSELVFVALGIQLGKHMLCTLLLFLAFRHYSFLHTIPKTERFSEKSVNQSKICVLISGVNFGWSLSRFKNNSVRYYHKFTHTYMKNTSYSCQILLKLEYSRQIFKKCKKCSNITFSANGSHSSHWVQRLLKSLKSPI